MTFDRFLNSYHNASTPGAPARIPGEGRHVTDPRPRRRFESMLCPHRGWAGTGGLAAQRALRGRQHPQHDQAGHQEPGQLGERHGLAGPERWASSR
jgi:hypothetical protein